MKLIIIIFLVLALATPLFATTREALYRMFGPRLIEAVVLVVKDEINILRNQHGLAERTNQQLLDALETKFNTIPAYDWME